MRDAVGMAHRPDLSFLAPPGGAWDWRMTLLYDTLRRAGVIAALPGTPSDLAAPLDLDPHAVRVVLDALTAWGVVVRHEGCYAIGPEAPDDDAAATLGLHARSMRRWCAEIDDRLQGVAPTADPGDAGMRPEWLEALAVNARRRGPLLVDACLDRFPQARSVLDLGGGHGEHALEFARRGLRATLQDRPPVIEFTRHHRRLESAGVELFAGDFHQAVPEGLFDLVFCAGVTHTMSPERNQALYRRLRPIVAPGGGLAISTFLRHQRPIGAIFAIQMLVGGQGGDTFSEEEYRRWLVAAGFQPPEVVDVGPEAQSLLLSGAA